MCANYSALGLILLFFDACRIWRDAKPKQEQVFLAQAVQHLPRHSPAQIAEREVTRG
jgi:hypothetical protein